MLSCQSWHHCQPSDWLLLQMSSETNEDKSYSHGTCFINYTFISPSFGDTEAQHSIYYPLMLPENRKLPIPAQTINYHLSTDHLRREQFFIWITPNTTSTAWFSAALIWFKLHHLSSMTNLKWFIPTINSRPSLRISITSLSKVLVYMCFLGNHFRSQILWINIHNSKIS